MFPLGIEEITVVGDHPNDIDTGKGIADKCYGIKIQEESRIEEILSIVNQMGSLLSINKYGQTLELSCLRPAVLV